jgi:hypothetical protein
VKCYIFSKKDMCPGERLDHTLLPFYFQKGTFVFGGIDISPYSKYK